MTNFEIKKRTNKLEGFGLGDYLLIESENSTFDDLFIFSLVDESQRLAGFVNVDGRTYLGREQMATFQVGDTRAIELFIKELQSESDHMIITLLPQSHYRAKVTLEEI